jgi:hypothetical protein
LFYKILPLGGLGVEGNSKSLNVNPRLVTPRLKGLIKRKLMAVIRGLYLNPIQNGGGMKF